MESWLVGRCRWRRSFWAGKGQGGQAFFPGAALERAVSCPPTGGRRVGIAPAKWGMVSTSRHRDLGGGRFGSARHVPPREGGRWDVGVWS